MGGIIMKKIIIVLSLILILMQVSCSNSTSNLKNNDTNDSIFSQHNIDKMNGDYMVYEDTNELYDKSELIIIATPTKEYDEEDPILNYIDTPNGSRLASYRTLRNINILKVIKGNTEQFNMDIIENQAYLKDENKLLLKGLAIPMRKDMQYILFLVEADILDRKYYGIITIGQGKYNIDNKDKDEASITDKSFNTLKNDALKMFNKQIESVKNIM